MSLSQNQHRNQFMNDLDETYEIIKATHSALINNGSLYYDDRTKMFNIAACPVWNEWNPLSYNQCRIAHNAVLARFIMQQGAKPADNTNQKL